MKWLKKFNESKNIEDLIQNCYDILVDFKDDGHFVEVVEMETHRGKYIAVTIHNLNSFNPSNREIKNELSEKDIRESYERIKSYLLDKRFVTDKLPNITNYTLSYGKGFKSVSFYFKEVWWI